MLVKTTELTGTALDWAVAKCWYLDEYDKDRVFLYHSGHIWAKHTVRVANQNTCSRDLSFEWEPSTDWSQGGPIIDREGVDLYCSMPTNPQHADAPYRGSWQAKYHRCGHGSDKSYGPTALVAAMRCFVASKLGDEVEIPDELTTTPA